jgi:transposase
MKPLLDLPLPDSDRIELNRRVAAHTGKVRDKFRAQIILMRASGISKRKTASAMQTSCVTVQKWVDRYRDEGIKGLDEKPGRGRKPSIPVETIERIITEATTPPRGRTRHSTRSMARAVGVSQHTVRLIWNRNAIKPHLTRTFKVSNDPNFLEKFWDVIGLYLSPPENSVVFCCDEKTQCQALERSQPGLPLGIGHIRTATHDYTRHGTTTLFAALNYASGEVLQRYSNIHTNIEWLAFLKQIEKETPAGLDIHIIAENYATHKHPNVKKWLSKHKRMQMHFTPTSSSWLNLVERFFGEITRDCVRDGSFSSVKELERAMREYIEIYNENPKPIRWHADGEEILRKINAARKQLGKPIFNSAH